MYIVSDGVANGVVVVLLELGEVSSVTGGETIVSVKHEFDGGKDAVTWLPYKLLNWVVEVKAGSVGGIRHSLGTGKLELVD